MKLARTILTPLLILITSVVITMISSAWASERKVVLLTSIDAPKGLLHQDTQWVAEKLEDQFSYAFDRSGFRLETIRQANAWQLHQALHDPEVVAVFWASHAGHTASFTSTVGLDSAIVTSDGMDIKAVFQNVGPQLKFFAILGCSAQGIVDQAYSEGAYSNNPDLKIVSFDQIVLPFAGMNFALNESIDFIGNPDRSLYGPAEYNLPGDDWKSGRTPRIIAARLDRARLDRPETSSAPEAQAMKSVTITRKSLRSSRNESAGELVITTSRGKFLGVIPPLATGNSQTIVVKENPERIRITAHSGSSARMDFAGLRIRGSDGNTYSPLSVDGHVIGADSQLWLSSLPGTVVNE